MTGERPRRVRLAQPGDDGRQGRTGCLAVGAVLGILAGVMVALYALPPILKSLYGEAAVRPGETRTVDGKTFRVLAYRVGPDPYCVGTRGCPAESIQVSVSVTALTGWDPDVEDFLVEVADVDRWIEAMDPVPGVEDTDLHFPDRGGSEGRIVVLRFPLPLGTDSADTVPEAVHVTTPRVKLELDTSLRR